MHSITHSSRHALYLTPYSALIFSRYLFGKHFISLSIQYVLYHALYSPILLLLKIMSRNICFESRTLFGKLICRALFGRHYISHSIRHALYLSALFLALYSARTMNLHIKFYQVTIPLFSQSGILFGTERKYALFWPKPFRFGNKK